MIEVQITKIPQVREDWTQQMALIGERMLGSIRENFGQGGRPNTWMPLKRGGPSFLFQSGNLLRSGDYTYDSESVTIGFGAGLPYAFAQQFGYAPRNLVPRPFVMFQDEDVDWITELMAGALFWYGDVTNPQLSEVMD
jgi:phage gpG-like protein